MRNISRFLNALVISASYSVTMSCAAQSQQHWTSANGKHTIDAEFVELREGKVRLRRKDQEDAVVPLAKLDTASQKQATELSDRRKAEGQPSKIASPKSVPSEVVTTRSGNNAPKAEVVRLSNSGSVVYKMGRPLKNGETMLEPGHTQEVYRYTDGKSTKLCGVGWRSNDMASDESLGFADKIAVSSNGKVAFTGPILKNKSQDGEQEGLWTEQDSGGFKLVARGKTHVSAAPDSPIFNHFEEIAKDDSGRTIFYASMLPGVGGVTGPYELKLFLEVSGELKHLLRKSNEVVGKLSVERDGKCHLSLQRGVTAAHLGIDEKGDVQDFEAMPRDSTDNLPERGVQVPGLAVDARFDKFRRVLANSSGQLAFEASLVDGIGGTDKTNNCGIWAVEKNGTLHLICRMSDDSKHGKITTVKLIGFNELGHIVYSCNCSHHEPGKLEKNKPYTGGKSYHDSTIYISRALVKN